MPPLRAAVASHNFHSSWTSLQHKPASFLPGNPLPGRRSDCYLPSCGGKSDHRDAGMDTPMPSLNLITGVNAA